MEKRNVFKRSLAIILLVIVIVLSTTVSTDHQSAALSKSLMKKVYGIKVNYGGGDIEYHFVALDKKYTTYFEFWKYKTEKSAYAYKAKHAKFKKEFTIKGEYTVTKIIKALKNDVKEECKKSGWAVPKMTTLKYTKDKFGKKFYPWIKELWISN